uniref:Uncharacterized protein n=1 Tax=Geospiza parvula TaxID=87175 RepID=A0A8C3MZ64_GEOPR
MLRTEAGGAGGAPSAGGAAGAGGLRSASPHRNAYEASIQALAPTKEAEGEDGKKSRGKKYGSNVHRIKNMFLQMGTAPGPEGACDLAKAKEKPVRLSLPRAGSLGDSVDQGSLLKLGTSVSERVSRFDSKPDKPFSKLQETRKIFERSPQEKATSTKLLLRKERAGFQDRKLDVVVRFNGSTESLDKLDADAVSPTVSQLSAVFEKADLRNNLHKAQGRARAPLGAKAVPKRPRVFTPGTRGNGTGDGHATPARARPPDEEKAAAKTGRPVEKEAAAPRVQEVCKIKPVEVEESGEGEEEEEEEAAAGEAVPAPQPAKGDEGPAAPRADGGSGAAAGSEGVKGERAEEGDGSEEAKKEDFSEADLVDISAYSGLGEDSGGSGLEEEEEAEGLYEPESGCVEIPGLSEEEEPVPNRKIQFSTAPIQVFSTYSNEDYDRRNEDVDPMAASAEYELEKRVERLDLFPVELEKDSEGLGISIIGMGAGADMGLEKLGIFVKTVTEGGAAHRDGRIQVNDLIVEVDGTSLVGVTQSSAASVLRNTKGRVRFLIGREKPGEQSEVAQLIQQTLEQERWQREMMEQRYTQYTEDDEETGEYATDEEEEMSPMFPSGEMAIEVFELAENEDALSPVEMDPEKLVHKFKELQIKHAVTEAEIQQLKRKLQCLEQEKALEGREGPAGAERGGEQGAHGEAGGLLDGGTEPVPGRGRAPQGDPGPVPDPGAQVQQGQAAHQGVPAEGDRVPEEGDGAAAGAGGVGAGAQGGDGEAAGEDLRTGGQAADFEKFQPDLNHPQKPQRSWGGPPPSPAPRPCPLPFPALPRGGGGETPPRPPGAPHPPRGHGRGLGGGDTPRSCLCPV